MILPRITDPDNAHISVLLEGTPVARREFLDRLIIRAREQGEKVLRIDLADVPGEARRAVAKGAAVRYLWDILLVDDLAPADVDTLCWLSAIAPPGAVFGIDCGLDEFTGAEGASIKRLGEHIHGVVSI
jgi:hypothetical protein